MPSYYERRIIEALEEAKDGLTTIGIAEKANISKTTALKYLASLRAAGKIDYIEVGPAKLWKLTAPKRMMSEDSQVSKEEKIRSILKEFKEIAGLLGSAVVDVDGLPISADLPLNKRPEKLCSLISRLLQVGERSLKAAGIGPLREMILEGDKGRIIARNEGKLLLIALTDKNSSLGIVKIEIEEFARKIKDIVS